MNLAIPPTMDSNFFKLCGAVWDDKCVQGAQHKKNIIVDYGTCVYCGYSRVIVLKCIYDFLGPKIDGMVRFYKKVQVQNTLEGFQVLLDGKRLKTPLKNVFQVKSRHLAMAVAHEWDNQKEGGLRPASMPLMSFASTVIDGTEHKNVLVDDMMKYFCSDTICFEADEKNSKTVKMQRKLWNPIRKWFTNEFQVPLVVNDGGIGRLPISEESRIKIKAILSHVVFELLLFMLCYM